MVSKRAEPSGVAITFPIPTLAPGPLVEEWSTVILIPEMESEKMQAGVTWKNVLCSFFLVVVTVWFWAVCFFVCLRWDLLPRLLSNL
jgi:hypothetical protein